MANITVYVPMMDVVSDIKDSYTFNEMINEFADQYLGWDLIGNSDEELTDEGKKFIRNLVKRLDELEK